MKELMVMAIKNIEERYKNFKTVLNMWSQRDLTLKRKIIVIKSLALSRLLYASSILCVPDTFIDEVEHDIFNFIWNGKPPKVKTSTMISDISDGGLKMPHFRTMVKAQKVMWVQRLLVNQCSKCKTSAFKVNNMNLFQITCKHSYSYINKIQSPFYAQVIKFWFEFYSVKPELK